MNVLFRNFTEKVLSLLLLVISFGVNRMCLHTFLPAWSTAAPSKRSRGQISLFKTGEEIGDTLTVCWHVEVQVWKTHYDVAPCSPKLSLTGLSSRNTRLRRVYGDFCSWKILFLCHKGLLALPSSSRKLQLERVESMFETLFTAGTEGSSRRVQTEG